MDAFLKQDFKEVLGKTSFTESNCSTTKNSSASPLYPTSTDSELYSLVIQLMRQCRVYKDSLEYLLSKESLPIVRTMSALNPSSSLEIAHLPNSRFDFKMYGQVQGSRQTPITADRTLFQPASSNHLTPLTVPSDPSYQPHIMEARALQNGNGTLQKVMDGECDSTYFDSSSKENESSRKLVFEPNFSKPENYTENKKFSDTDIDYVALLENQNVHLRLQNINFEEVIRNTQVENDDRSIAIQELQERLDTAYREHESEIFMHQVTQQNLKMENDEILEALNKSQWYNKEYFSRGWNYFSRPFSKAPKPSSWSCMLP